MKTFYYKLFNAYSTSNTINISKIFNETQDEIRQKPKFSDPYYWAAYILIK
jgi:CHAT domain-containing protein